ncbi:unnamed protein product [Trifolium pratense]|uniref:Uncharacterized protein n=1 Tax=Trifolium pratense TaxID=57577 RepID=A0ACB0IJQ9_TRIPR|nr:unnamed protein product [Trifolium pratense]
MVSATLLVFLHSFVYPYFESVSCSEVHASKEFMVYVRHTFNTLLKIIDVDFNFIVLMICGNTLAYEIACLKSP